MLLVERKGLRNWFAGLRFDSGCLKIPGFLGMGSFVWEFHGISIQRRVCNWFWFG